MVVRDLGPLEIVREGRHLNLGSRGQLALVGVLLVHANEVVSVDRLVEELWGETAPPTAPKIVRNHVSTLRRELGDRLATRSPGYMLKVETGERESERLEQAVQSGDLEELTDALALWRGSPLSQFAYERFAETEIARLEELHRTAVEAHVGAELERGVHAQLIPKLEALVREHPLRERLIGQLMLALYRSGRQAGALEVYRRARERLGKDLGIEPGPALRELERKILNQDESLAGPISTTSTGPSSQYRRRGLLLVVAAGLVLLAAAGAATFFATRESPGGLREVRPNHVGVIDPKTNAIVGEIPVGIAPGPVTAGKGAVWVANVQDRNLTKIDARRRAPVATFSLDNRTPTGLAVGAGAVWVAHGPRGEVSRIDPEFGQIAGRLAVTTRPFAAPTGSVAIGAGSVWAVFGDSTLAKIDVTAGRPRLSGSTLAGSSPSAIVVGGGSVWVANAGDSTVQEFDPRTFTEGPVRPISVGRRPAAIAYGAGALWVADQSDDAVTRIDPETGSTSTIPVGSEPVAVAVGSGTVWVANSGDGTLSRIDPVARKVVHTVRVGSAPSGIAIVGGLVWVASRNR